MKTLTLVKSSGMIGNNAICKNYTAGTYHVFSGGSSLCGSSRRHRSANLKEVQNASVDMFCDKCFKNGKPDSFEEFTVKAAL